MLNQIEVLGRLIKDFGPWGLLFLVLVLVVVKSDIHFSLRYRGSRDDDAP